MTGADLKKWIEENSVEELEILIDAEHLLFEIEDVQIVDTLLKDRYLILIGKAVMP